MVKNKNKTVKKFILDNEINKLEKNVKKLENNDNSSNLIDKHIKFLKKL